MEVKRRTQAARSAATRAALTAAARALFGTHGYAAVGTEAIVRDAGVTRGALYHQFADKREVFAAVLEAVEQEAMARLAAPLSSDADPVELLETGIDAWLEICTEPEFQRIVLLDGPSVLGWDRWREIGQRYGAGLVESGLQAAMEAGRIASHPVRPLAHLLIGALDEAALYVARADDPARARREMGSALRHVLRGLVGEISSGGAAPGR
jgi:AcrR family transcriptional regulator